MLKYIHKHLKSVRIDEWTTVLVIEPENIVVHLGIKDLDSGQKVKRSSKKCLPTHLHPPAPTCNRNSGIWNKIIRGQSSRREPDEIRGAESWPKFKVYHAVTL